MDLILLLQAIASFSALFFIFYLHRGFRSKRNGPKNPPEVAGRWPLIGHLHLLPKNEPLEKIFGQWADKYGPIFTVWIGSHQTVVFSSWEQAKECFTINDKVLATRPRSAAGKYLCYNYSILGVVPYGPLWREGRKMAMLELLSAHRLDSFARLRASEIGQWMQQLHHLWVENERLPVKVEMKEQLQDLTFNTMLMMVARKRYFGRNYAGCEEEAKRARKAIAQFFYYFGVFVLSDAIPWLEWLDVMGHIGQMKWAAKELHSLISVWWEEHLRRRGDTNWKGDRDFIDVMVSTIEEGQISGGHANSVIKTLPLTMIIVGSDTTSLTLIWTLSLLVNNPRVLKKMQEELDSRVGRDRNVEESDIVHLPYLQAVVKETLRLYPAAPLSLPHEAMEDCHISGYHIPAGTRVMVNLRKLHQDIRVWSEPNEFHPERFLTSHSDFDVRGKHFEYLPFGSGRRICPAITSALQITHLTLARLLHGFELASSSGEAIDMTEGGGITLPKITPLDLLLSPRLPSHLYD